MEYQGTSWSDTLTGTSGDDFFDGKGGNDVIDGGDGTDTILIFADSSNFELTTLAGVTKINGLYGSGDYWGDEIYPIKSEIISFSDQNISIPTSPDNLILGTQYSEQLIGTTDYLVTTRSRTLTDWKTRLT